MSNIKNTSSLSHTSSSRSRTTSSGRSRKQVSASRRSHRSRRSESSRVSTQKPLVNRVATKSPKTTHQPKLPSYKKLCAHISRNRYFESKEGHFFVEPRKSDSFFRFSSTKVNLIDGDLGTDNKIHLSVSIEDFEKAFNVLLPILTHKDCPFKAWKTINEEKAAVSELNAYNSPNRDTLLPSIKRILYTAQFTLYMVNKLTFSSQNNKLNRDYIQSVKAYLLKIEAALKEANISPSLKDKLSLIENTDLRIKGFKYATYRHEGAIKISTQRHLGLYKVVLMDAYEEGKIKYNDYQRALYAPFYKDEPGQGLNRYQAYFSEFTPNRIHMSDFVRSEYHKVLRQKPVYKILNGK